MLPMYYPMQAQIDAASRHANRYLRDKKAFDVPREISIGGETVEEGRDDSSDGPGWAGEALWDREEALREAGEAVRLAGETLQRQLRLLAVGGMAYGGHCVNVTLDSGCGCLSADYAMPEPARNDDDEIIAFSDLSPPFGVGRDEIALAESDGTDLVGPAAAEERRGVRLAEAGGAARTASGGGPPQRSGRASFASASASASGWVQQVQSQLDPLLGSAWTGGGAEAGGDPSDDHTLWTQASAGLSLTMASVATTAAQQLDLLSERLGSPDYVVTSRNCLEMLEIADTLRFDTMRETARQTALRYFPRLYDTEGFDRMPASILIELAGSDALHVRGEDYVYLSIMKWIRAQRESPSPHEVMDLMRCVRFPQMERSFFEDFVAEEPVLLSDPRFFRSIAESALFGRDEGMRPRGGGGAQ